MTEGYVLPWPRPKDRKKEERCEVLVVTKNTNQSFSGWWFGFQRKGNQYYWESWFERKEEIARKNDIL
jgi:hypothetical protein